MDLPIEYVDKFIGAVSKYGSEGIAILSVVVIIYLVNKFLKFYETTQTTYLNTYESLQSSIQSNTEVTKQMYEYMKLRNGSLDTSLKSLTEVIDKCKVRGK